MCLLKVPPHDLYSDDPEVQSQLLTNVHFRDVKRIFLKESNPNAYPLLREERPGLFFLKILRLKTLNNIYSPLPSNRIGKKVACSRPGATRGVSVA